MDEVDGVGGVAEEAEGVRDGEAALLFEAGGAEDEQRGAEAGEEFDGIAEISADATDGDGGGEGYGSEGRDEGRAGDLARAQQPGGSKGVVHGFGDAAARHYHGH